MDDRGFATPALFVVVIGGLLMLGLALDVALYAASWRETAHLADVAAETGAGVIDEKAVYQGDLLLDRPGRDGPHST